MNLDLNKEQRLLKSSARDFLKKECPRSLFRESRDTAADYPENLWNKMAELGWMGVGISEEYDGMGEDFIDLCILMEAMGEACLPAPFFSTVAVAGTALRLSTAETLKKDLLPQICAGEQVISFALIEPGTSYGWKNIAARAVQEGGSYKLNGTKLFVEYAASSDFLLTVVEIPGDGPGLFLVKTDSPGIVIQPLKTLDYARQCSVVFNDAAVPVANLLAKGPQAEKIFRALEQRAATAKCAEMVGGMQAVLEMTVNYAKDRVQFSRPIGSFQAIQHHCANMAVKVAGARYITQLAAWNITKGLPADREASMAKSYTNEASNGVVKLGHQVHAAISYCDEYDMHLFLRKSRSAKIAFGDTEYHMEKLAGELGL